MQEINGIEYLGSLEPVGATAKKIVATLCRDCSDGKRPVDSCVDKWCPCNPEHQRSDYQKIIRDFCRLCQGDENPKDCSLTVCVAYRWRMGRRPSKKQG